MRQMMLREHQLLCIELGIVHLQRLRQDRLLEQLFLEPDRQRPSERLEALRRKGQIGLEQPLEFQEGLFVEDDIINAGKLAARFLQAPGKRVVRKAGIVFAAGEALLLRRRDDPSLPHQRHRTVVVEGRDSQNLHVRTVSR